MRFPIRASLIVLTLSFPAAAKTLKVGPSQPIKTLAAAASMVAPGDLVEVDGDATYGAALFDVPGAAGNPITIRGLTINGKRPVISGGTNTIEAQGDHYVFENFELTGGSSRCFYHHADDITLRGSVIHDCPTHGLLGADADSGSLLLEYTEVYKCGGGTQHHQIYMATDETAHPGSVFRMQHCYVHDANGGNNVKSRAERNEIYYNWIEGALYHELELIGPDGQAENLAREDSDVVGNVLVKKMDFYVVRFGGDGTGQTFGRYRFVNNTVVSGANDVFRLFDGIESVEMHSNVFYNPGGAVKVFRDAEAAWVSGQLIGGSNNWLQSGAMDIPSQWTGTVTGASPGLSTDDFPQAGSPVIDAGDPSPQPIPGHAVSNTLAAPLFHPPVHALEALGAAVARPVVGTIDIGAYEYGMGSMGTGGSGAGGTGTAGMSSGTGGTGTAGMSSGTGGTGTAGMSSGTGGTGTAGMSSGTGGTGTAGTSSGTGGTGTAGTSSGKGGSGTAGTSSGKGGTAGTSSGTGGGAGTAATAGSAGATSGKGGNAGTTATGGKGGAASGGKAGAPAVAGAGGAAANGDAPADSTQDGGCGCRVPSSSTPSGAALVFGALVVALGRRRRRP